MSFDTLDWNALDRLRAGFLSGEAARGPYWRTEDDLAGYDVTYGERIGWKWDAVLEELRVRGWKPPAGATLLDWGCGSGIAGRRVLAAFGPGRFGAARVWDHSELARRFALARMRAQFPGMTDIGEWPVEAGGAPEAGAAPLVLVVSHVINELSETDRTRLLALAAGAAAVLWVEPGTHADSRALAGARDELLAGVSGKTLQIVGPCTHRGACPLFQAANERHWCHFFARPPVGVQNDSGWVRFGQRAGVDLRSLPYAFLVLARPMTEEAAAQIDDQNRGASRVLGRPEFFKGYARMLGCEEAGLREVELQKRVDPRLFKELERRPGIPLFRWQYDGRRIVNVEPPRFPDA